MTSNGIVLAAVVFMLAPVAISVRVRTVSRQTLPIESASQRMELQQW